MSLRLVLLSVAVIAGAIISPLAQAADSKPIDPGKATVASGSGDRDVQTAATPQPDLDAPVSTTLRKINRMLTNAYNKGYAAGLNAAAQAEGSQDDIRDIIKQATPRQKP